MGNIGQEQVPGVVMPAVRRFAERFRELVLARPVEWAVAFALLVALPTTMQPFLFDDHAHLLVCEAATGGGRPRDARHRHLLSRRDAFGMVSLFEWLDGTPETHRAAITTGAAPWWTLEGLRISFWRPLSSHLLLLDFALFGEDPVPYHLHSVLWYLAMILAWWLVLRRSLPRSAAVLALLLFTLDGAHQMPVGFIANRHALVSGTLGLFGLAAYLRWCEEGWRLGIVLSVPLFALALLGGENALGVMAYAGAHALFFPGTTLPNGRSTAFGWRQRLVRALPVVTLAATWACVYKMKGFGTWGSGVYIDPASAPGEYLIAAPSRLTVLLGDHLGGPPADLWSIVPAFRPVLIGIGLLGVGAVAIWLKVAWRSLDPAERAALRWMISGALFALIPMAAAPPMSRLLLIPSLGGSVLLAVLIRSGWRAWGRRPKPSGWARIPPIAAVALAVMHLAAQPIGWWAGTAILGRIARDCTAVAQQTAALLAEEGVNKRHVVVLNSPHVALGMYLPAELYRLDVPLLSSCHVISLAPRNLLLRRRDARTLEITVQGGELLTTYFETLWRSPRFPMKVGDAVDLGAFRIEIDAVGERGPTRISLRFDKPLSEASVLMLAWYDGALRVVPAPAVGTTMTIAWSPAPLDVKQSGVHAARAVVLAQSGAEPSLTSQARGKPATTARIKMASDVANIASFGRRAAGSGTMPRKGQP